MLKFYPFFVIALIFGKFSHCDEIGSEFSLCKYGDNNCFAKEGTKWVKILAPGRPDLNLPSFDPLYIASVTTNENSDNPVNLKLKITDMNIKGLSNVILEKVVGFEKDSTNNKFEFYGSTPSLHIGGEYTAKGRFLVIPINGAGNFSMTINKGHVSTKLKAKFIEKGGKAHLFIEKMKILAEPESAKIQLTRFIQDSNPLGDSINDVINESWKEFWAEIHSPIMEKVENHLTSVLNALFGKYPYEKFFLPE